MSHPVEPSAPLPISITTADLRRRKRDATQALLGDTIAIPDELWQQPSRLPGWTRAHVATHLARSADAMRRVTEAHLTHLPTRLYPDELTRQRDLEQGSQRGALELQIDLDTSAGLLNDAFGYLEESGSTEEIVLGPGLRMPAHHLPIARLAEVVLHHVDLNCGFEVDDIEPDIARWLLEWTCLRSAGQGDLPPLEVTSTSGVHAVVGAPGTPHPVQGTDAALLGWLTGRSGASAVVGAEGLDLPETR